MMPIRVLHIVTYMGRGGLETMLMNYYRNIDRNKIQFDFLTHRDFEADYDQEIKALGGRIYHLPKLNPYSKKYLQELERFFEKHKEYKIVHSHLDCMAGIQLKYAKKKGVPVRIAHSHNCSQEKDLKYPLKLVFKRSIARYATYLFACSHAAGRWMFGNRPFAVLYNAIDAEKYIFNEAIRTQMRKELKIEQDTLVIGHVGRICPQKNHDFLLEVFEELLKKHPNSTLLIVGEGPTEGKIKLKCERMGLSDKVIFTGGRSDVPELLQAMDVFVFPSLFEGLGIANIEAQAAGLPCLISDKVPMECEKTKGLIHQLSLESGKAHWADCVLDAAKTERRNVFGEIRDAGYDIKENAAKLGEFYLTALKNCEEQFFE